MFLRSSIVITIVINDSYQRLFEEFRDFFPNGFTVYAKFRKRINVVGYLENKKNIRGKIIFLWKNLRESDTRQYYLLYGILIFCAGFAQSHALFETQLLKKTLLPYIQETHEMAPLLPRMGICDINIRRNTTDSVLLPIKKVLN